MSNFPGYNETPPQPERNPILEAGWEYCGRINQAIELASQLKEPEKYPSVTIGQLEAIVIPLKHESFNSGLPFNIKVSIPEGANAHKSRGYKILDEHPHEFIASELRRLDTVQIDFHEPKKDLWLVSFDHNLTVEPVLPE